MVQVFRPARYDDDGMMIKPCPDAARPGLYFFGAAGINLIKIGHVRKTHRVADRLHALQPGCPYRLSILFVLEGADRLDESRLHKLWAEYNHDREWFRCEGRLKRFLQLAIACPDEATAEIAAYLIEQRRLT